jgi:carboxypeptidase Taq
MATDNNAAVSKQYIELCAMLREASHLGSIAALLGWDQETYMPEGGNSARGDQKALLAGMIHERRTSSRVGELLAACEADASLTADDRIAANLREIRRDYDLATKLPKDLVEAWAKTGSDAQAAWKVAREKSNFKAFAPHLEKMFALARRKAECYGVPSGGEAYDALLNEYEPGATAAMIEATFTPLRARLTDIIRRVKASKTKVDTSVLGLKAPAAAQHELGHEVLRAIGFDLSSGRLDTTTHPFCEGLAPGDTRLTTRYRDEKFTDALFGTMHEAGHGMYEQGLPKVYNAKRDGPVALFGTPLAEAISLGIHESQSRMWENFVGRGRPFVGWLTPRVKKAFGKAAAKVTTERLYRAVNTCTPSFIRVEADEATYNMHVMVRFEIERGLLNGTLNVKDVPGVWNAKYAEYLGVKVPDDRRGCLQDVHWSFGLIGYFPTYTLGNLYAAQFWETIQKKVKGLDAQMAKGDYSALKKWLNTNIHIHGRRYRAGDLCQRVTGAPLSAEPLLRHLERKLGEVYGI